MNVIRIGSALALAVLVSVPTAAAAAGAAKAKAAPNKKSDASTTTTTAAASSPATPAQPSDKPAEGTEPSTEESGKWSVAALGGFGASSTKLKSDNVETKDSFSLYGAGFGARAGYTLPMKVYVGGTFVYHVGETTDKDGLKLEGSIFYVGAEGGYELALGPVVARPYLGLAYASVKAKATAGKSELDASAGKLAFWPGATVFFPIDRYFVGADARFVVVPGVDKEANASAFSMFATAGARF